MNPNDPKNLLWNIRPAVGITIRFPQVGEPQNKYIEQNRQSCIAAENRGYENGWIPNQHLNWWRRKWRGSDELVPPPPQMKIRMPNGVEKFLRWQ